MEPGTDSKGRHPTAKSPRRRRWNGSSRPSATTDATLIERCCAGDPEAWRRLVERYSPYVYAITIRGYRLEQDDADDVLQEVFARAYERLPRLRDAEAIRAWLGRTTRHLAIDRLRVLQREQPIPDVTRLEEVDGDLAHLHQAMWLRDALDELPEHCREVLDRFFRRDESYRMIEAALQVPPGTVASRISRCLARLREALLDDAAELRAGGRGHDGGDQQRATVDSSRSSSTRRR